MALGDAKPQTNKNNAEDENLTHTLPSIAYSNVTSCTVQGKLQVSSLLS